MKKADDYQPEDLLEEQDKWRIQSALADWLAKHGTIDERRAIRPLFPEEDDEDIREIAIRYGKKLQSNLAFRRREMFGW
ncbi:MAG TPA: hypothetical protein VNV41_11100 [Candidatus Acidoferrales bacterium]|jgi:hypothetical protein|nr:hypothetical protein [Candidatus Acidoferrales bacterium]